jgi:hypothetical protein
MLHYRDLARVDAFAVDLSGDKAGQLFLCVRPIAVERDISGTF